MSATFLCNADSRSTQLGLGSEPVYACQQARHQLDPHPTIIPIPICLVQSIHVAPPPPPVTTTTGVCHTKQVAMERHLLP